MTSINRRGALAGTAAALGATGLTACGDQSRSTPIKPSAGSDSDGFASTSDVPVGGCHVTEVGGAKVVLTQPEEGSFKCFSAICTHQGCTVSSAEEGVIPCRCHGSQFSLDDGSVVTGPATAGLEEVDITVDGESISVA
jgi:Rieske Fe-S protein